jgi:hypothetical protein
MAKAKKKSSKKKTTRKRSSGLSLRKVPYTQYALVWDGPRNNCTFGHHGSGVAGAIGCGTTDIVSVYTDGKRKFYILSVNYEKGYAGIEILDSDGLDAICFADPQDMAKLFPGDLENHSPSKIAKRLAEECR